MTFYYLVRVGVAVDDFVTVVVVVDVPEDVVLAVFVSVWLLVAVVEVVAVIVRVFVLVAVEEVVAVIVRVFVLVAVEEVVVVGIGVLVVVAVIVSV